MILFGPGWHGRTAQWFARKVGLQVQTVRRTGPGQQRGDVGFGGSGGVGPGVQAGGQVRVEAGGQVGVEVGVKVGVKAGLKA